MPGRRPSPRRRGRTGLRSRAQLEGVAALVGEQPEVVEVGHVERLAAEDERRAVDSRPSVEVAPRRQPGRDLRPGAIGKRPEVVQRERAGRLTRIEGQCAVIGPPAAVEAAFDGPRARRASHRPGSGPEVVRPRVREARAVGREPVADPEPAVGADGATGPVAGHRHIAAAGKLQSTRRRPDRMPRDR